MELLRTHIEKLGKIDAYILSILYYAVHLLEEWAQQDMKLGAGADNSIKGTLHTLTEMLGTPGHPIELLNVVSMANNLVRAAYQGFPPDLFKKELGAQLQFLAKMHQRIDISNNLKPHYNDEHPLKGMLAYLTACLYGDDKLMAALADVSIPVIERGIEDMAEQS